MSIARITIALLACGVVAAAPDQTFALRDVKGLEHAPFAEPGVAAVVLIFTLPDCPIANGYAPEIKRLCTDYGKRGVRFFLVHADPDTTANDATRHARDFGLPCPVVLDPAHALVRRAGATRVPETAVFAADGQRKYRGRIDDTYVDYGKRRPQPTSRDLRLALEALLGGQPVPRAETAVIGCFIPLLAPKDKSHDTPRK